MVKSLSAMLILAGTALALYPLFTDVYSWWVQQRLKAFLATRESQIQAYAVRGNPTTSRENSLDYGLLEIPRLNLSVVVLEGTRPQDLLKGSGRFLESALPGKGNTAIAGHRTMYGGWFRNLDRLQPGDLIWLKYRGQTYGYEVQRVFPVLCSEANVTAPCDYPALTLVTCSPSHKSEERLVVRAKLIKDDISSHSTDGKS